MSLILVTVTWPRKTKKLSDLKTIQTNLMALLVGERLLPFRPLVLYAQLSSSAYARLGLHHNMAVAIVIKKMKKSNILQYSCKQQ